LKPFTWTIILLDKGKEILQPDPTAGGKLEERKKPGKKTQSEPFRLEH